MCLLKIVEPLETKIEKWKVEKWQRLSDFLHCLRRKLRIMSTSRIKLRLQTILKQRGVKGLIGLRSAFHEFDLNKNGLLSYEEFGL